MKPLHISSHVGLGDQVYLRPFVLELARRRRVYLDTAWPELYWNERHVGLVPRDQNLRTQRDNLRRCRQSIEDLWSPLPGGLEQMNLSYTSDLLAKRRGVTESLRRQARVWSFDFTLPVAPWWITDAQKVLERLDLGGRGLCIIRQPTVRREWAAPARNPEPGVLHQVVSQLRDELFFLAIGHTHPRLEVLDGHKLRADAEFLDGELHWTTVAGLMRIADVCVSGPCFMLPLGIALRTPTVIVFGGHVPSRLLASEQMGLEHYTAIEPDPFCFCNDKGHRTCNKTVDLYKVLAAVRKAAGL